MNKETLIQKYVDQFNQNDEEIEQQDISNEYASEKMVPKLIG